MKYLSEKIPSYMQKGGKESKRTLNTIIKIKVNLFNDSFFRGGQEILGGHSLYWWDMKKNKRKNNVKR